MRGGSSIARRFDLSPLIIGLTVVAYGTSAPELVVSLYAALGENAGIALGNVVGSNITNIGLILGLSAVLCPIAVRVYALKIDVPMMIGANVLLVGLMADGGLGRRDGVWLLVGAIVYTAVCIWGATFRPPSPQRQETFDPKGPARQSLGRTLFVLGGGLVALVLGARLLVDGAVTVAEAIGLSQTVIGLTVVALGTSLPELATSVVAAARGEGGLALGNVVGSNTINIVGILGTTATLHPINTVGITTLDVSVMVGSALLTLPLLWTGYTFSRGEGGALVGGYCIYLAALLWG